jgi:ribosomal protein S18 acetylase RimI-like enzyme
MIKTRRANIEDANVIIDFQIRMALETENLNLEKEIVRKGVIKVFNDISKGKYYIIIDNDKIVGSLLITPEWSDWRNGSILWIQSLYIDSLYRRKGLFKYMYNYLKKMVEESDELLGLRLYVDKSNKDAQIVYENIGMDGNHYKLYEWIK